MVSQWHPMTFGCHDIYNEQPHIMRFNDLRPIHLRAGPEWRVTFNELLQLEPDEAESVELPPGVADIWQAFGEDLMQAENREKGLFVDVGWTRCANPTGHFRLLVLPFRKPRSSDEVEIDWMHPLASFETRSLRDLLEELNRVMGIQ